ncbi:phosphoenolpyruvate--protein phosphotransferase, partial [Paenibacillus sp.]
MNKIHGIAASAGISIARAYRLAHEELIIEKSGVSDIHLEMSRFDEAVKLSLAEIEILKERTQEKLGEEKAEIFESHLMLLSDAELIDAVKEKVNDKHVNAEYALQEVSTMYVSMFENMKSAYLQERAADMRDVTKRVLSHLLNVKFVNLAAISEEVVLIAKDLTPSDTAQLDRQYVKGFVTNIGGRTSHSAIMARSLEIPAVVGTKDIMDVVIDGDIIIIDGMEGHVIIHPTDEVIAAYHAKQVAYEEQKAEWAKLRLEPTLTQDGHHVELGANIGTPTDVDGVLNNGGEAVGLYRTEFLYMGRDKLPTEEEQFSAYKTVLQKMSGKPVVVRTLD